MYLFSVDGMTVPRRACHCDGCDANSVYWYLFDGFACPKGAWGHRGNHIAKFWLDPVALAHNGVLNRSGLRRVERIVKENRTSFPGRWNARFNN